MKKHWLSFLVFVFIISCNSKSHIPSDVIKPQVMQNIFWDLIRGDILAQEIIKKDSTKNLKNESYAVSEKVFFIHHVNRDKFEKSMAFYSQHPEILKPIFDSLSAKQGRRNFGEEMRKGRSSIEMRRNEKNIPYIPTPLIKKHE